MRRRSSEDGCSQSRFGPALASKGSGVQESITFHCLLITNMLGVLRCCFEAIFRRLCAYQVLNPAHWGTAKSSDKSSVKTSHARRLTEVKTRHRQTRPQGLIGNPTKTSLSARCEKIFSICEQAEETLQEIALFAVKQYASNPPMFFRSKKTDPHVLAHELLSLLASTLAKESAIQRDPLRGKGGLQVWRDRRTELCRP